MICTNCMRDSLEEVGFDIWGEGEEKQYVCNCSPGEIRSKIFIWPETVEDDFVILYTGIYERQPEIKLIKNY